MRSANCNHNHNEIELIEDIVSKIPSPEKLNSLADFFKAFSDPNRLRIIQALSQNELCVCDLAALLDMTKSAISHQLKALRLSNLVKTRREGQVVYYSLADDHVKYILDIGFDHIRHD